MDNYNTSLHSAAAVPVRRVWWNTLLLRQELLLVAVLALAALLRVYDIAGESIWYDEGYSIRVAQLPLARLVEQVTREDYSPPLYYLLLHGWMTLFGSSEEAVRSLSVLFGLVSIVAVYQLGLRLFDQRVGLLSALLMATAEFHVEYSQETRAYNLLAMLGLLSLLCFVNFSRSRRLLPGVAYVVVSALMLYTHIFGMTLVLAQNAYIALLLVLQRRQAWPLARNWVAVQLALIVTFVPYLLPLLDRVERVQAGFWLKQPTLLTVVRTFAEFAGSSILMALFTAVLGLSCGLWLLRARSSGWRSVLSAARQHRLFLPVSMLLLWLALPLVLAFVMSYVTSPIYLTRYLIGSSVALYLLVAAALVRLLQHRTLATLALAAILLVASVELFQYYTTAEKEPWREVVPQIEATISADEPVVFYSANAQLNVYDYYAHRSDVTTIGIPRILTADDLARALPEVQRFENVLLVLSHGYRAEQTVLPALMTDYRVVEHRTYIGIETYALERQTR